MTSVGLGSALSHSLVVSPADGALDSSLFLKASSRS